jgi:hypothetical protein
MSPFLAENTQLTVSPFSENKLRGQKIQFLKALTIYFYVLWKMLRLLWIS